MKRTELAEGVVRICFAADEAGSGAVEFASDGKVFLRQISCDFAERPVYSFGNAEDDGEKHQTANGEVTVFHCTNPEFVRMSRSAELRFAYPGKQLLTGLGQHEDGVYDYSTQNEMLYQNNMIISLPFLLGSDGWGLLFETDCAMRYYGEEGGFRFVLDAADDFSYVVFRGKDCADVLRRLTAHIGRPEILPKWCFGYVQSAERYHDSEELIETAAEFRRRGIGLDCIVQDWFTWREGCWGDKNPDPERFPDIPALTDALHGMNVKLMVSVWPNIGSGRDCDEFLEAGGFLPGSRIYDAFSEPAQELYWQQCMRQWMGGGTDALWCDSDEPITDPDWCGPEKRDTAERYEILTRETGLRYDPVRMNGYADAHCDGLYRRWRRDLPEKRVVVLSRSGGMRSGAQGVILWSGDQCAKWDVLRRQIAEGLKMSACGISYWTLDIGAFFVGQKEQWFWRGDYPLGVRDPAYRELYVRWFQYGAMLPIFRSHGTDTPREPWRFGEAGLEEYDAITAMIRLRYRLIPYIYSTAAQARFDGLPMMRGLLLAFPEDEAARDVADSFMLGGALLAKPVTKPLTEGGNCTEIFLPRGVWYDLFGLNRLEGGQVATMETPLDRFPLLAKAGSILPTADDVQCTAEMKAPLNTIWVFCGADGAFDFYDDEGDGYAYQDGAYLRIPMCYSESDGMLELDESAGTMPADFDFSVCFVDRDGVLAVRKLHYSGSKCRVYKADGVSVSEQFL